jgi:Phytanoyl-CoA dioxygenase (PhyH)
MLFTKMGLSASEKATLDHNGHVLLPGHLTPEAQTQLTAALAKIEVLAKDNPVAPRHYSAEHSAFLASLIAHPELLALAQAALGPEVRFDHCVALNRAGGDRGIGWHSHDYAEDRPELGFVRIFFYVNGFRQSDGGLKVVPGSQLFRDPKIRAESDEALRAGWLAGKLHPRTGEPLEIVGLDAPEGSVVLMHTHAAHAVTPRQPESPLRWCVVYAYRNPGAPVSAARWITPEFEKNPPPGAAWLMPEQ